VQLPHVEKLYGELAKDGFLVVGLTQDRDSVFRKWVKYNKGSIVAPFLRDTVGWEDRKKGSIFKDYHAYAGKQYFITGEGKIFAVYSKIGLTIPRIRLVLDSMGVKGASKQDGKASPGPRP
jgi:hypothetical protein